MKKHIQILWLVAAFILFLFPFPLYGVLSDYIDTTNHENRELAEKPELVLSTLADYPDAYDDWMNDNLPFRNQLVAMNSLISIYVFNESPTEKVIIGKDGWFFYNSAAAESYGSNTDSSVDSVADFQGTNLYSTENLEKVKNNLVKTQEYLAEQGIEFVLYIVPNKEQVYADKMPDEYGELTDYTKAQQIYDYIRDDVRVIYAADALAQARQTYPNYTFYYPLGTHWNKLGAYVGAQILLQELGHDLPSIDELTIVETENAELGLSSMMNLKEFLNYGTEYLVTGYSSNTINVLSYDESDNRVMWRFNTSGADSRKVLVIRDSFSIAMSPYLASQFNEIVFVHRDYYDASLLEEEQPDIVIYETVERYLDSLKTIKIVP